MFFYCFFNLTIVDPYDHYAACCVLLRKQPWFQSLVKVSSNNKIVNGDERGDLVLTKWFYGFDSWLVLAPLRVKAQQKQINGCFDPLTGQQRPGVLCLIYGILHIKHPLPLFKKSREVIPVAGFTFYTLLLCAISVHFSIVAYAHQNIPSRAWFRSTDLWVMGPARFHCATLLILCTSDRRDTLIRDSQTD